MEEKYSEEQYHTVVSWIRDLIAKGVDKDSLLSGEYFSNTLSLDKNILLQSVYGTSADVFDYFVKKLYELALEDNVIKIENQIRLKVQIPRNESSAWQKYKKRLLNNKWSEKTVNQLEKSAVSILQNMTDNSLEHGPTKGLVVGNVQSGKTANMAGVMALGADFGFNIFIVLSGTIESLRLQTSQRLYKDMNADGKGKFNWKHIENPSLRVNNPQYDMSNFHLESGSLDRYFMVCLKNKSRLEALVRWLYSDSNKMRQMKILIIDDEADQASINTNDIYASAKDEEEIKPTVINGIIKRMVHQPNVRAMNYVAYTATPYANILNETGPRSLYPKDYIIVLPQSPEYIGPSEIFGTSEPEQMPRLDIVRPISIEDIGMNVSLSKGTSTKLPKTLTDALNWLVICVAALRHLEYRKPISMLIHTSYRVIDHQQLAKAIDIYMKQLKDGGEEVLEKLRILYEDERLDFSRQMFLEGFPDYPNPSQVPDYPKWEDIKTQIERIFRLPEEEYLSHIHIDKQGELSYHKGFHLAIDNSQAAKSSDEYVRLMYPHENKLGSTAPAFIVIGGNTLSRGLTIEGLVSTYFLRQSKTADTLLQMARWFGYRKSYEIFPRIWLDFNTNDKFQYIAQMNEELRGEIESLAETGLTPSEYGIKLKQSPNQALIRLTSSNKMQSAKASEFNFNGFSPQVVYYDNCQEKLVHNFRLTEEFLNRLGKPQINGKYMVWQNISFKEIASYLTEYHVSKGNKSFVLLPALVKWCEKNKHKLSDWSIVLTSKGELDVANPQSDWNIHGYAPRGVVRTKLKSRSSRDVYSIGVLRGPADMLADIPNLDSKGIDLRKPGAIRAVRAKNDYENVPQLLIYRIEKDGVTKSMGERREPLNLSHDAIGISVWIPGTNDNTSTVEYVAPTIPDLVDMEEYHIEEDSDNVKY